MMADDVNSDNGWQRFGEPDGTPVVLLHSSQSSRGQWRALINELIDIGKFDVLAIDLLGYGGAPLASTTEPFRFSAEVARVKQLVAARHWQSPVMLVGHSYGGALALKLALEEPFPVAAVAVFEPVSFHVLAIDDAARQEVIQVSEKMHGADAEVATRAFVDYWNQPGYFDALPPRVRGLMSQQAAKVALDFDALLLEPKVLGDYAKLRQPCLCLTGEFTRDSAKAVSAALLQVLPNAYHHEVPAGHMAPLTHPQLVNPYLIDFLQTHGLSD